MTAPDEKAREILDACQTPWGFSRNTLASAITAALIEARRAALEELLDWEIPCDVRVAPLTVVAHGNTLAQMVAALKERGEAIAAGYATPSLISQEPDDLAVDRFAAAMKAKLARKREQGRGGWDDPAQCTVEFLTELLHEHVLKGDPVDVGNFAMMLFNRGALIPTRPDGAAGGAEK